MPIFDINLIRESVGRARSQGEVDPDRKNFIWMRVCDGSNEDNALNMANMCSLSSPLRNAVGLGPYGGLYDPKSIRNYTAAVFWCTGNEEVLFNQHKI